MPIAVVPSHSNRTRKQTFDQGWDKVRIRPMANIRIRPLEPTNWSQESCAREVLDPTQTRSHSANPRRLSRLLNQHSPAADHRVPRRSRENDHDRYDLQEAVRIRTDSTNRSIFSNTTLRLGNEPPRTSPLGMERGHVRTFEL